MLEIICLIEFEYVDALAIFHFIEGGHDYILEVLVQSISSPGY